MKDYSKFVKYPKGFIISYEIKDGIIYITTPETLKKGLPPQEFPATKVNIKYFEAKMEKQYRLLIENRKEIIDSLTSKGSIATIITSSALAIISAILLSVSNIAGVVLVICALVALGGGTVINKNIVKKLESEFKTYEKFLNNRQAIETASQEDKNITKNLSETTKKNIERQTSLKSSNMIENIFNVDFMDKTSLEDLKEMLLRYTISRSLQSETEFQSPNQDEIQGNSSKKAPKKRSRKPKTKNNQ